MFNTLNVRGQGMLTGQGDRADVDFDIIESAICNLVEKILLLMLTFTSLYHNC